MLKLFPVVPLATLILSGCFEKVTDYALAIIWAVPPTDAVAGVAHVFQPTACRARRSAAL